MNSPDGIHSPPYSVSPSLARSIETITPESPSSSISSVETALDSDETSLKYIIASHSVRITKHGYAIDPVRLRYPEIVNKLSTNARRSSKNSFDYDNVGHRILSLIRGFWSQPNFPNGVLVQKYSTVDSILKRFNQIPPYPHKTTYGGMSKLRPIQSAKKKGQKRTRTKMIRVNVSNETGPKSSYFTATKTPSPTEAHDNLVKNIKDKFDTFPQQSKSPTDRSTLGREDQGVHTDLINLLAKRSPSSKGQSTMKKQTSPPNTYHSWIPKEDESILDLLTSLCRQMEEIFSKEDRIIHISSPCLVLGDIHGNLLDLRTYERSLWAKAPVCVTNNYLFLGDYVDRGDYSIECVIYLFALKLLSSSRFFLLRGNHEVAAIQRQYTFSKECESKFGLPGRRLWKSFNKVFDLMPIAAIIDNQIFCAHGGIPRAVSDIKSLAKSIPSPLDNPETQCPAAWEILWNDPITDSELQGMIEMDNAVVTQTQTTQTQTTPNGTDLVTTTTNTTAISTDAARNDSKNGQRTSKGFNEADTILTREPAEALSFYIRPTDDQPSKSISVASKEAAISKKEDENVLRTVPSDTSSIASTSSQQIMSDGFVANIKRGTAFLFSDQAINHFLKINNLSHVIRAHEVIPTGFAFHGDGRVLTIFSSSKYCGLNNQAACALVDRDRIRILRLDTGEAGE